MCVCGSDVSLFANASWRIRPCKIEKVGNGEKSKWDTFVRDSKNRWRPTPEATESSNRDRGSDRQQKERESARDTSYKMLNNIYDFLNC